MAKEWNFYSSWHEASLLLVKRWLIKKRPLTYSQGRLTAIHRYLKRISDKMYNIGSPKPCLCKIRVSRPAGVYSTYRAMLFDEKNTKTTIAIYSAIVNRLPYILISFLYTPTIMRLLI